MYNPAVVNHIESLENRTLLSGLTIVPTFAASIRRDANSAAIEAAINAGIRQIESLFSTPITVPVTFAEGGGLGSNVSGFGDVSYAQWRAALAAGAHDANQRAAVASLPQTNTVNGSNDVQLTYANEMALGISDTFPASFATITLNTASCNLTRASISPYKYDLQDVAMHELDEVLGIGSVLDNINRNGDPVPTDSINPEDFFRYSAGPGGKIDFTTDARASIYFSIDGGATDLAQFNQDASGDFNDWYSINGDQSPQVQDAFGTPGVVASYNVEPVVLDVLGYTPSRPLGTGSVIGSVFNDVNADGLQDESDADESGWTVEAVQGNKVITSVQSNADGYQLGSLPDGSYEIEVVPQPGYTATSSKAPYLVTITGQNDVAANINFGERSIPVGPIAGTVYRDVSGNGTLDGSQVPLAGVKITLHEDINSNGKLDGRDKLIGSVVTGSSGAYSFGNLLAGEYFITETVPRGYVRTAPALSNTESVTLAAGEQATDLNFENFQRPPAGGIAKVSYTTGSKAFKNLRGHTAAGETVSVTFTVTRPAGEQVSFVSYATPAAVVSAAQANQDQLFDSASGLFAPGTYTLSINLPGSGFYQIDFVSGDPLTRFGPAGSGVFYTVQGRLIAQG